MSAMQRSIFVSSFAILVGNKLVVCIYKSNWGGESKYQCVSKKKFLLNEENKKYIREVLTTYKCEIPDELKEKK